MAVIKSAQSTTACERVRAPAEDAAEFTFELDRAAVERRKQFFVVVPVAGRSHDGLLLEYELVHVDLQHYRRTRFSNDVAFCVKSRLTTAGFDHTETFKTRPRVQVAAIAASRALPLPAASNATSTPQSGPPVSSLTFATMSSASGSSR